MHTNITVHVGLRQTSQWHACLNSIAYMTPCMNARCMSARVRRTQEQWRSLWPLLYELICQKVAKYKSDMIHHTSASILSPTTAASQPMKVTPGLHCLQAGDDKTVLVA